MTDKLQDVVERFIAEHETEAECGAGSFIKCIDTQDLRAFLEQYVLCEREPVAWLCRQTADGNVDATARREVMMDYARFKREITELHAPAKGWNNAVPGA